MNTSALTVASNPVVENRPVTVSRWVRQALLRIGDKY